MNAIPKKTTRAAYARPYKRASHTYESPLDKELHSTLGLSAEVGKACSAWLTSRGIKTIPWGRYFPVSPEVQKSRRDFHLPNNP
jgi:hypothetical protein